MKNVKLGREMPGFFLLRVNQPDAALDFPLSSSAPSPCHPCTPGHRRQPRTFITDPSEPG